MRGFAPTISIQRSSFPATAPLGASRGERVTFLLLALAMLGAIIPVGPAIPSVGFAAITSSCTGSADIVLTGRCAATEAQTDGVARVAAARIPAMLLP